MKIKMIQKLHLDGTTSAKVSDEIIESNTNNHLEQDKNVKLKM